MMKNDQNKDAEAGKKNALEWVVFGVGALMLSTLFIYLAYQLVKNEDTLPILNASGELDHSDGVSRYMITVRNDGTMTAADVLIKVSLWGRDSIPIEGELLFPFVPRKSKRSGWYQFEGPELAGDSLAVNIVSYRKP